jgi:MFS family permease
MVSLSATMGLIMMFVWGIFSDNTRTKYGRRRPYLLFGIMAGTGMIVFGLSQNYYLCLILDVVIIGVASNAYLVAERALIPDTVEIDKRGRANGIINMISYVGVLVGVAFLLLGNELFGIPDPRPGATGTIIPQEGHLLLLSIGGIIFATVGIIGFILIKERPAHEFPEKKKFLQELRQTFNLKELKSQKEFYKMTLAYLVFQTGTGTMMAFLFLFIFDLGASTLELLMVIGTAFPIVIILTFYLGKVVDKYGRKKYIPLMIGIISLGFFPIPFTTIGPSVNLILLSLFFPFALTGLLALITPLNAWAQDLLPEDKRGKFTGIFNIVETVSQIIGSIVGGIVATIFGIPWLFWVAPIFYLASIPFFLRVKETLTKEKSGD